MPADDSSEFGSGLFGEFLFAGEGSTAEAGDRYGIYVTVALEDIPFAAVELEDIPMAQVVLA